MIFRMFLTGFLHWCYDSYACIFTDTVKSFCFCSLIAKINAIMAPAHLVKYLNVLDPFG